MNEKLEQAATLALSVVAPMHNEQDCVREFCTRTARTLEKMGLSHEIIVVDDGSSDRTGALLDELTEELPRLRAAHLARNSGQAAAVDAGVSLSRGDYVVVMDGDLQHLPEEIPILTAEMDRGFDLVSATRRGRRVAWRLRRLPCQLANWLLRAATGCPVQDMGGFKCLRGDIARRLNLRSGQHRLLPALVYLQGGSVTETPISAPERFAGTSHYGISRVIDVICDILLLWFQASFKSRPVYLFGRVSLAAFALGFLYFLYLLAEKIFLGADMGSRPPFFISLALMFGSLGFFSLGLVLEQLSDTQNVITGRKPYTIQRVVSAEDQPKAPSSAS